MVITGESQIIRNIYHRQIRMNRASIACLDILQQDITIALQ